MPTLNKVPAGKKKLVVKNEKQLKTIFARIFSVQFYDKIVTKLLKDLKIKVEDIPRVNQYASEDKGHSFVTIFFKHKEMINPAEVKVFQKEARKLLKSKGYLGTLEGKFTKYAKLFGKSRRAVELPLIWKSKSVSGCYCLFFERFA